MRNVAEVQHQERFYRDIGTRNDTSIPVCIEEGHRQSQQHFLQLPSKIQIYRPRTFSVNSA